MREQTDRSTCADVLLVCPAELLHRTDLHADGLQGIVIPLPALPVHSNSKDGLISPPAINSVGVCMVTLLIPECPQIFPGTVSRPDVLVFVEGGEFLSVVMNMQTISCRNTAKIRRERLSWTEKKRVKLSPHSHIL